MSEPLFPYYERELLVVRQLTQEFAKKYPSAARRLLLEPNRSTDPHVERLIEAFALIAGRIQHRLDNDFPELTDSLLNVLYPHYLAPVPSMTILQFQFDPARASQPNGFLIDRHSPLHTQAVGGLACKFRTTAPLTLWPIELTDAKLLFPPFPGAQKPPPKTLAILRLQFECQGTLNLADLTLDKLRLYIDGDDQVVFPLYELILNHTIQVAFRPLERDARQAPVILDPAECLSQVGFERDEGGLPYPNQAFLGYRLLTEFFAFPYKFMFIDLGGWRKVRAAGYPRRFEVLLYLNRAMQPLEPEITVGTFRLGCVPAVNLFRQLAEPVNLKHSRYEYRLVPDNSHPTGMEVYSIDSVTSVDPTTATTTEYEPFYSFRHGGSWENKQTFWYASRRASLREGDRGTEVYLHLVNLGFNPALPADEALVVRLTCTNRDLVNGLQRAGESLSFELELAAPVSAIRCRRSPTPTLRPPLRRGAYWRLVSHLCLNHLSVSDALEGRDALQEILRLYDFSDPEVDPQLAAVTRQMIEGILALSSRRVVGRTGGPTASGFARGLEVSLTFDEEKYFGGSAFLFASVLERFLGLYASINSFTQLVGKMRQGEGHFKKWPPRAGEQQLL